MSKLFNFLSNAGKVVAIYMFMFLISLVCISFSSNFSPNYHRRCTLDPSTFDFSFISKYEEIENYEIFVTCNTLDIVITTNINSKDECIALVVDLSYSMPKYKDLQITIKSNIDVLYFKIVENGVVLAV